MKSKTKHHSKDMTDDVVAGQLAVKLISFGYKEGAPPPATMTFDVRFLKNPFWVDELRPLTGLDSTVQKYVLEQPLAITFLDSLSQLLTRILPQFRNLEISELVVALGCTGGQHRSTALVEALAKEIERIDSGVSVSKQHRELNKHDSGKLDDNMKARKTEEDK